MSRRGFSLVELVVATTLVGLLGLTIGFTLRAAATSTRTAVTGLTRARDLSTTMALLRTSTVGADLTDIRLGVRDTIDFDRRVGQGSPCHIGGGLVVLADEPAWAERQPLAGRDEILVLTQVEPAVWERRPLLGVAPVQCPDLRPALALGTPPGPSALWVRLVTPVRMRTYRSGGATWLGLEDRYGAASLQPFAGPLTGPIPMRVSVGQLLVGPGPGMPAFRIPFGPLP